MREHRQLFHVAMSHLLEAKAFGFNALELAGLLFVAFVASKLTTAAIGALAFVFAAQPKKVVVLPSKEESGEVLTGYPKFNYDKLIGEQSKVFLWDPATLDYFGEIPAHTPADVDATVARAKQAQLIWKKSSFATRKLLMRTMQRFITENQDTCARVAVRDSGKTLLCAMVGEVMVSDEYGVAENCITPSSFSN
jgi:Aldehyde dehydrogenase family